MLGITFELGIYLIFHRILSYFYQVEFIGQFLVMKLLSLIFMTFFSFVYFSNIIIALSTFYLSSDINLFISLPLPYSRIVNFKFWETFFQSSWMIIFISIPIFLSLGHVSKSNSLFYLFSFFSYMPFLVIPSALGILTAGVLVKIFSAAKIKNILVIIGFVIGISFYLFFRFLKPEQFVDPDRFLTLTSYLVSLKATDSIFLPTVWILKIVSFLNQGEENKKEIIFYFLLILSNALFLFLAVHEILSRMFFPSWSKAQEGKKKRISFAWFAKIKNPIIRKDLLVFFRDPTQWSQLFLLLSLVVVYIYNFSVLPLDKSPLPTLYLKNLLSFLNLGLAGFVLASVSVRFAFPSVSFEKEALLLIKASPWSMKKYLRSKFQFNLVPIVFLAVLLIYTTNKFLQVDNFMMIISIITIFFLTLGIVSLGISLGAMYPQFKFENKSSVTTSFGGLVCMLISVAFIGIVISLESWSVYWILWYRVFDRTFSLWMKIKIFLSFFSAFIVCILVFIVPFKMGYNKLSRMEL